MCTAVRSREKRSAKSKRKRLSLRQGQVSPPLIVPENIPRPPYVGMKHVPEISSEIQVHNSEGIARMQDSCRLAAQVLEHAGTLVKVAYCHIAILNLIYIFITIYHIAILMCVP